MVERLITKVSLKLKPQRDFAYFKKRGARAVIYHTEMSRLSVPSAQFLGLSTFLNIELFITQNYQSEDFTMDSETCDFSFSFLTYYYYYKTASLSKGQC